MRRGSWVPLFCLAAATVSLPVLAQPRPGGTTSETAPQTEDQRKAQEHFHRARELYQAGKYSEAIAELEVARGLDPKAKDLVLNLGIVHERLGKYDEAIGHLRSYLEMDGVTPAERARAEGMIKRIEGAKDAAPAPTVAPTATAPTTAPPPTSAPSAEPPPRGRVDALTVAAGAVAVVGLGVGAGVGIYALGARPAEGFVTGRDGSYATLQQKTNDAHTAAIVADVSLGVGVVATLVTAWLYFGRTKAPASAPEAASRAARFSVTPAPARAGGAVLLGGAF
ncbi:MAG: tetratricopeptide repeat protein [Labilithrix sp.]|nr:tetratricopeptide repeat protein [Labilithrix sp.]